VNTDTIRTRIDGLKKEFAAVRARHPRLVNAVLAASAGVAVLTTIVLLVFLINLPRGLPDDTALSKIGEMDQATAVFDATDALAFTIYKEQRIEVPLSEISPRLIQALIATEDQRFYEHHGFDVKRIASAALANVRHRRAAQGASTITQQLARQSFLTPDKTFHRKLQELILAERIERRYPKERILELYLNKVYFGDGLYGAEAAARGFFGKHASDLDLPEAAMLAGLVKSPSTYAPTISKERAIARRNVVLQAMLDAGAIAHNHYWFRTDAIDACLDAGDLDAVLHHADALERYAAAEPTAWSRFIVARGRTLVAARRGTATPAMFASLRARANEYGYVGPLPDAPG